MANIHNLKQVDYSGRGQIINIIVDGVPKSQTVIFSRIDWLPEFESATEYDFEDGLYDYASAAKHKGSNRACDSLMIDSFSKAYPDVIDEVKRKEPPLERENYDVPSLNLRQVSLSEILEQIYQKFVCTENRVQKEGILAT